MNMINIFLQNIPLLVTAGISALSLYISYKISHSVRQENSKINIENYRAWCIQYMSLKVFETPLLSQFEKYNNYDSILCLWFDASNDVLESLIGVYDHPDKQERVKKYIENHKMFFKAVHQLKKDLGQKTKYPILEKATSLFFIEIEDHLKSNEELTCPSKSL